MSFFGGFKSFFEKVGAEIKKLFGSATFEQQVQSMITYAAPILEGILELVDPLAVPAVTAVINIVKSDFGTISATVQGAAVAPGSSAARTVAAAVNSVDQNLNGLLQLAEVKNSTKVTDIKAAVDTLTAEFDALVANLPSSTPAAAA